MTPDSRVEKDLTRMSGPLTRSASTILPLPEVLVSETWAPLWKAVGGVVLPLQRGATRPRSAWARTGSGAPAVLTVPWAASLALAATAATHRDGDQCGLAAGQAP